MISEVFYYDFDLISVLFFYLEANFYTNKKYILFGTNQKLTIQAAWLYIRGPYKRARLYRQLGQTFEKPMLDINPPCANYCTNWFSKLSCWVIFSLSPFVERANSARAVQTVNIRPREFWSFPKIMSGPFCKTCFFTSPSYAPKWEVKLYNVVSHDGFRLLSHFSPYVLPTFWDLGWIDFDFGFSTVCPILLGQTEILQNWLGSGTMPNLGLRGDASPCTQYDWAYMVRSPRISSTCVPEIHSSVFPPEVLSKTPIAGHL